MNANLALFPEKANMDGPNYQPLRGAPRPQPSVAWIWLLWWAILAFVIGAFVASIVIAVRSESLSRIEDAVDHCVGTCPMPLSIEDTVRISSLQIQSTNVPPGVNVTLSAHCYSTGTGGHDILFLHGFFHSWMMWVNQLNNATLKSAHNLYSMDWRGMGESSKPYAGVPASQLPPGVSLEDVYSADAYADDLHNTIQQLGLNKPILVVHSAGVFLVADYLNKYGFGDVGGLLFVGAFSEVGTLTMVTQIWTEWTLLFVQQHGVFEEDLKLRAPAIKDFVRFSLSCTPGLAETEANFLITNSFPTPSVIDAIFNRTGPANEPLWNSVPIPACIVHGTTDQVIRFSWGQTLASQIPGAVFTPLPVGHVPPLEDPIGFNDKVLSFAASVPAA